MDPDPDPDAVLAEIDTIRARGRRLAHDGAWLPALMLAALPLLSVALYQEPFVSMQSRGGGWITFPYWAGLPEEERTRLVSFLFWLTLTPLTFGLIAFWYRRREHRWGVRLSWWAPVVAGAAVLISPLVLMAPPISLILTPLTFVLIVLWYRRRERGWAVHLSWCAPVVAGAAVLVSPLGPLVLASVQIDGPKLAGWGSPVAGLFTPLVGVGVAATALGIVERSVGIVLSGAWLTVLAWWFCATGVVGGMFGWLLGMDRAGNALVIMVLPLAAVGVYRALRRST